MLLHWIWLAQLKLNTAQKLTLLDRFGDAEDIYYASREPHFAAEEITAQMAEVVTGTDLTDAQKILDDCVEKGIRVLTFRDAAYPERLRNIDEPPVVLYCRGILPDFEQQPVIAAVGTRKASAYGLTTAKRFGGQIAACGALLVSGGAGGIDTMAMEGALEVGRPVVGILGCGVDVVYPKTNRKLFERILENGCLLSEFPPETPPHPWNFPVRNRILSGISCGSLIVEAPEASGALITARLAMEQGRDVFVVPGNVDVASCAGSNALLREGAIAVFNGWDVVREYAALWPAAVRDASATYPFTAAPQDKPTMVAQKSTIPAKEKLPEVKNGKKPIDNEENSHYSVLDTPNATLSEDERTVLACLTAQPQLADAVIADTGLPAGKVLSALTTLALKGLAVNYPGRRVALKKG